MHIHSYPKVYAIGHPAVANLFADPVLVEEKIDGSQFTFLRVGPEIFMRSRGADIFADAPEKMFALAVESVKTLADKLHEGWVYRGEFLAKPKHNVLCYERVPKHNIILFDINTGDEVYLSREEKEAEAERIGMDVVPAIAQNTVLTSAGMLLSYLDRESILGAQKVEGIVVKNYVRFGRDKKALMGKYVREDFKEKHAHEWKTANPSGGDVIEALCIQMRNDKRWEKAIFHLRDKGELESSPRDIGKLIAAVKEDISEEEREYIAKRLLDHALPRILRASTSGMAEWYKERLLKSAFEPRTEEMSAHVAIP